MHYQWNTLTKRVEISQINKPIWKQKKKRLKRPKATRGQRELGIIERKLSQGLRVSREDFFRVHDRYLLSREWLEFRQVILRRAGGLCENCFQKSKVFHVHHLTYERWKHEEETDVIALCVVCHYEIHHGKVPGEIEWVKMI